MPQQSRTGHWNHIKIGGGCRSKRDRLEVVEARVKHDEALLGFRFHGDLVRDKRMRSCLFGFFFFLNQWVD